ncbi:MAG: anthranilate phosphoribosyltransferase [Negativicutes bacterium]|nr:anthranilate phosphoribosyltransferase [Negativicutes bacterium]
MLKEILGKVVAGENLSRQEAQQSMETIMSGAAGEAQIGSLLTALRMKGESSDEIAGFAQVMRNHTVKIDCDVRGILDTCGTGGDRKGTFNISTAAAFVVAGAGVAVAKHGNHGISSSCGSADVLQSLGVRLDLPPRAVGKAIARLQIGFLYAPAFHPAMKYAGKPRRELGFRTCFNLLGPLTNPAEASHQLIGVYDRSLTAKLAEVLLRLGTKRAMVVHSLDGMDEISTTAPTQVSEVVDGQIRSYVIEPAEYGFLPCGPDAYRGGTPAENAVMIEEVLRGKRGSRRDIVLINAAAAMVVAGKAADIREGLVMSAAAVDNGAALAKLEALREFSQHYRGAALCS